MRDIWTTNFMQNDELADPAALKAKVEIGEGYQATN